MTFIHYVQRLANVTKIANFILPSILCDIVVLHYEHNIFLIANLYIHVIIKTLFINSNDRYH